MLLTADELMMFAICHDEDGRAHSESVAVADFENHDIRLGLARGAEGLPDAIMLGAFDGPLGEPLKTFYDRDGDMERAS